MCRHYLKICTCCQGSEGGTGIYLVLFSRHALPDVPEGIIILVQCTVLDLWVGYVSSEIQSTFVISKSKGSSKTLRDIRTSTYQICSIEEKQFEQPNFTNDYVI